MGGGGLWALKPPAKITYRAGDLPLTHTPLYLAQIHCIAEMSEPAVAKASSPIDYNLVVPCLGVVGPLL